MPDIPPHSPLPSTTSQNRPSNTTTRFLVTESVTLRWAPCSDRWELAQ